MTSNFTSIIVLDNNSHILDTVCF